MVNAICEGYDYDSPTVKVEVVDNQNIHEKTIQVAIYGHWVLEFTTARYMTLTPITILYTTNNTNTATSTTTDYNNNYFYYCT